MSGNPRKNTGRVSPSARHRSEDSDESEDTPNPRPSEPRGIPPTRPARSNQASINAINTSYQLAPGNRESNIRGPNQILADSITNADSRAFLTIPRGAYADCREHCLKNSSIFDLKNEQLSEVATRLFRSNFPAEAEIILERLLMLHHYAKNKRDQAEFRRWLAGLQKNDRDFRKQVRVLSDKMLQEIQQLKPKPQAMEQKKPREANASNNPRKSGEAIADRFGAMQIDAYRQPLQDPRPIVGSMGGNDPLALGRNLEWNPDNIAGPNRRNRRPRAELPDTGDGADEAGSDNEIGSSIATHLANPPNISSQLTEAAVEDQVLRKMPEAERNILTRGYRVRENAEARAFFVKGRVFSVLWHENAGRSRGSDNPQPSQDYGRPFHVFTTVRGEVIYSHIRRFVIVKVFRGYVWAIPIYTYRNRGCAGKKMREKERCAHAIIYTKGQKPFRIKDEKPFTKNPILVLPAPGEEPLSSASRLHFSRVQSINWNIKMKDCGMVDKGSLNLVKYYFRSEAESDDDEDDDDGDKKNSRHTS